MNYKNIFMIMLFCIGQASFSMGKSIGKEGLDNIASNFGSVGKEGLTNVSNNLPNAGLNAADKIGKTATGLVGLGILWSACGTVKSWVWPSRADKVVAMSTNEAYQGLAAKCALKACLKANIDAPRDEFGFPIACRDQAAEYAFEHGRVNAKEMGATFNEFYPRACNKKA